MIEKVEIAKHNGSFYFTGEVIEINENWIQINTTRGEVLKFRKDQVMQREVL